MLKPSAAGNLRPGGVSVRALGKHGWGRNKPYKPKYGLPNNYAKKPFWGDSFRGPKNPKEVPKPPPKSTIKTVIQIAAESKRGKKEEKRNQKNKKYSNNISHL
jgi:hypothetical protein